MARPRKNEQDALARIENAFWSMMENGEYRDITIKALAMNASVNHNSIYYYFKNIDGLAEQLFLKEYEDSICNTLFDQIITGHVDITEILNNQDSLQRLNHIRLFARSESPYLKSIFITHVKAGWLKHMEISEDELSLDEQMDLAIILNGITAILGLLIFTLDAQFLTSFFERNLGKSIGETFKQIIYNHQ